VWQWRTGRRLYDIAIEEAVRPFIAVRRARPKRGYDNDGERKPPTRRWLARQRRREAKATTVATAATDTTTLSGEAASTNPDADGPMEAEVEIEEDGEDERDGSEDGEVDVGAIPAILSAEPEEPQTPVLVVQKIETTKIDERLVVVFSAVGCVSHLTPACENDLNFSQRYCLVLVRVAVRPYRRLGRGPRCTCARL
jgi:hypothetical protein